jgi:hypothetical protein
MEDGCSTQGISQAKRVVVLLHQGHRRVVLYFSLVRIAQMPQRRSGMAAAMHTSIQPMEERRGAVLLGVVERDALHQEPMRRS